MKSHATPPFGPVTDRSQVPRTGGIPSQNFFTIDQVADALSVSSRTVRRWIKEGKLVAHRFGVSVRIGANDLATFVALHRDI